MNTSWTETRDPYGAQTFEFAIERVDMEPVTGAMWIPQNTDPGECLILFGHGISYDRYHLPIPYLAKRFADECGWASLAIDGPGHGLRMVEGADDATFLAEIKRPTVMDEMVVDWNIAIEVASERIGASRPGLGYFGLSMGTMFGLQLIAERDDIEVAALGLLGSTGPGNVSGPAFLRAAKGVNCPVVYMMQLDDETFPRDGYLEIFDAIAAQDKRLHANPGGHVAVTLEEIDYAFDFMRRHLDGTDTGRVANS